MRIALVPSNAAVFAALVAMVGGGGSLGAQTASRGATMPRFESTAELTRFVQEWKARRDDHAAEELARNRGRWKARASGFSASCGRIGQSGQRRIRQVAAADTAPAVLIAHVFSEAGQALFGANVTIESRAISLSTNESGAVRISVDVPERGQHVVVRARLFGYAPQVQSVVWAPGDTVIATFRLCTDVNRLSSVVVTGAGAASANVLERAPFSIAQEPNERITNTQHAAIDEGGIVKMVGRFLVVLRQGRLHTVDVGDDSLRPVASANAYPRLRSGGDFDEGWFDEMLTYGNRVVVIGYDSHRGGIMHLFRISPQGAIAYEESISVSSGDYYSSRNYASRLLGHELVFYSPHQRLAYSESPAQAMPRLRRWSAGSSRVDSALLLGARDIHYPRRKFTATSSMVLHVVTRCDLRAAPLVCTSRGLLGFAGETHYVSANAVYLWSDGRVQKGRSERSDGALFRLPFDGGLPTAVGVRGSPAEHLAFLEDDDRTLHVLVSNDGFGGWMWNGEVARSEFSLASIGPDDFGDGSDSLPKASYRELPNDGNGALHMRFVGRHLIYGSGAGWFGAGRSSGTVHVVPLDGGRVTSLPIPHSVDRIEAMGTRALVVGTDSTSMYLRSVDLGAQPALAHALRLPAIRQGETRSHGFFYRPTDDRRGVIGLPTMPNSRQGWSQLIVASAAIQYIENAGEEFRDLGKLIAKRSPNRDKCDASCVDWYGNTRPIFLGARALALIGQEVVEGTIEPNGVVERRRIVLGRSADGRRLGAAP